MQEIDTIKEQVSPVLTQERSITVITSADSYGLAAEFLKEVKAAQSKVTSFFAPMKKKAHDAWKEITTKERDILQPLKGAEFSVKTKMLTFDRLARAEAAAEQAKLQAEADARAEAECEHLLKQAANLKTPALQEQRLAEAEEVEAPVITVQSEAPKVEGISTRKTWKARVVDKKAFIRKAFIDNNLLGFIIVDEKALNKVAQATKGSVSYPGIKFYQEESMAAGGR